jgi:hypothetical protein
MLRYSVSRQLQLTTSQCKSLNDLHRFRNKFVHFLPQQLLLRTNGFEKMAEDALTIVRFLLFESGNVIWSDKKSALASANLIARVAKTLNSFRQGCGPSAAAGAKEQSAV